MCLDIFLIWNLATIAIIYFATRNNILIWVLRTFKLVSLSVKYPTKNFSKLPSTNASVIYISSKRFVRANGKLHIQAPAKFSFPASGNA